MKFLIISIGLAMLIFAGEPEQKKKLAWWNFEKQDSLVAGEKISGTVCRIQSNFKSPEYVKGIDGDGLRLDGYSTYVTGKLPEIKSKSFTLGGWFALETFPNDTAGFFSATDRTGRSSISATVDPFGKPMIGLKSDDHWYYFPATQLVEKFKWIHVVLVVNEKNVELWIDGNKTAVADLKSGDRAWSEIIIGRDQREKYTYGLFPSTGINGLVDEITLWEGAFSEENIRSEFAKYDHRVKPDLSIPAIRFENDFNRPEYHLLPVANWTNETHGLILYKGRYHIFNQKNGNNVFLGHINWGHFSSPDLIHWTEHKPALSPEFNYDFRGIWSGHVVISDKGTPVIAYTGSDGNSNGINFAYSQDDKLIQWAKDEKNPLVKSLPESSFRKDMRDPFIWKEGDTWYMMIGFGITEDKVEKGSLLLYKSRDLKDWNFVNHLFTGDPAKDDSGVFWEMPVLWKTGSKYVLLVNKVPQPDKPAVALYWVGEFKNEKFIPDHKVPHKLELINRLLSPSIAEDEKGRTVAIAIIPDETSAHAQLNQGWTHLYSIPRIWSMKSGKLVQKPMPELSVLRGEHTDIPSGVIQGSKVLKEGYRQVEISLKLRPVDCKTFGLTIGKNADGSEYTRIYYDFTKQKMIVDSRRSTKNVNIPKGVRETSISLAYDKEIDLHIFIDGSVAEVFVNDEAFTTRFFPTDTSSNIIEFFTEGGKAQMQNGDLWLLNSSNLFSDW